MFSGNWKKTRSCNAILTARTLLAAAVIKKVNFFGRDCPNRRGPSCLKAG